MAERVSPTEPWVDIDDQRCAVGTRSEVDVDRAHRLEEIAECCHGGSEDPGGDSGCDIGVTTPHAVLAPSQNTEQTPLPIEWVHSIDTVFGPRQEFLHDHGVEAARGRSSVAALGGFRGFGYGVVEIRCGGEAETGRTAAETVFDDEPSVRIRCSNAVDVTAEPRGRGRKSPLCERGGHEVFVQDDALRTGFECGDDAPGSPQLVGETGRQNLEFVVIE